MSLQGIVLPVGGIKEKCMAAHRNKVRNVILPLRNREDAKEIPKRDTLSTSNEKTGAVTWS